MGPVPSGGDQAPAVLARLSLVLEQPAPDPGAAASAGDAAPPTPLGALDLQIRPDLVHELLSGVSSTRTPEQDIQTVT